MSYPKELIHRVILRDVEALRLACFGHIDEPGRDADVARVIKNIDAGKDYELKELEREYKASPEYQRIEANKLAAERVKVDEVYAGTIKQLNERIEALETEIEALKEPVAVETGHTLCLLGKIIIE